MTLRRYYDDSYTTRFTAQVLTALRYDDRPAVILDQTCFYPSSGGQPHDTGTLNETEVVDVVVRPEDGAVVHLLAAPLAARAAGGCIDWARRFDHMQHHTGQHILSQAFLRVAEAGTVGFHLGEESVTIDLDRHDVAEALLADAEALANQVIWDNRPVAARQVSFAEAASLDLRKIPDVDDDLLRLVDIAGFDLTACGGTHVAATGEVGQIKLLRVSRQRRKLRVEFRCGGRALRDYGAKNTLAQQLTNRLTVGQWEVDTAVARLQEELKATRRALKKDQAALLAIEAAALRSDALIRGPLTLVCRLLPAGDADRLRQLAQHLTREEGMVAVLAAAGPPVQVVAARAATAPGDMSQLLSGILADLEAAAGTAPSGGGGARFAQGGGVNVPPAVVNLSLEKAARRLLAELPAG